MRRCDDCRVILDSGYRHCPRCGREILDDAAGAAGAELEVSALLTSSNLHRMREEWDEALADATAALKLEPTNGDIVSLIGTIHEQCGRLDEAAAWYSMAVQMQPDSSADAARLERVRGRIAATNKPLAAPRDRTKLWIAMTAAVLFAVMVWGAIVLLGGRRAHAPTVQSAPTAPPRSTSAANTETGPPPSTPPGLPRDSSDLSGASAASSATRTAAEERVRTSARAAQPLKQLNGTVDDVIADPRTQSVILTFTLPASRAVTRGEVIAAAAAAARAAFEAHAQIASITTRCVIGGGTGGGTQIAFVGDVSRAALEALPAQSTPEQFETAFAQPWWSPAISAR